MTPAATDRAPIDRLTMVDGHRQFIDRIDRTILALLAERSRLGAAESCAYQGAPGAFSEDAAAALVGPGSALLPYRTLRDVFAALASGAVTRAVVPLENSLAGPVPGCAELLAEHRVRILAERVHPIQQTLIAAPGVTLDRIRRVRSHPMAIAQCTRFFAAHPDVIAEPTFDTAGAVDEIVRRGWTDAAAIANRRAAEVYGAAVLVDDVQDRDDNVTRFVLIEGA
ncbi:MAG TPA: prephenate dehydratase domain-containing protein [Vicinamibacterales bacterium]|nr:prephenate dehydratase domain-containing protein [Vicinamibacterales bacterium]